MLKQPDLHKKLLPLVKYHKGSQYLFRDLPFACRVALAHYLGEVSETYPGVYPGWEYPQSLEILKKLPDREGQSAWLRSFRNHVRKHLSLTQGMHVVGLLHVPVRDITNELDGSALIQNATYEDWHREVAKTSYVPQHPQQDIGMRWPILLATRRAAPPLLDGWHRFSRYYQLGYKKVPALYFVHQ
jgi:hypothetical protein